MTEEDHPEVYKVIGAPGTGKTTRVVGNPDLGIEGLFLENMPEYDLADQMLVTYTNAGVDEAAERLDRMLPEPKNAINSRVTTIHSRCFQILGLNRDQVVSHWDKKNWCDLHDLEYGWDDEDGDDIMSADKKPGNALMDIYSWLQSNRLPLSEWRQCPNSDWGGTEDPEWLMSDWEQYKDKNNLVGFGDMIEQVIDMGRKQIERLGWGPLFSSDDMSHMEVFKAARDHPNRDPAKLRQLQPFVDTKVLYVDEVQDLDPLQWSWYLMNKLVAEKVYIGGDDDQTIYGWSGANPEFMLNEEGDFEVLNKTYRIPEEIWEVADGVIEQVDVRQEKEVIPDGDGGDVATLRSPSHRQVMEHIMDRSKSVFILFRARYQIDEFRESLHNHGIPYRNMSTFDTWSSEVVSVKNALSKLKNGSDYLSGDEVEALMDNAPDHIVNPHNGFDSKEKAMSNLAGKAAEDVKKMFDMRGGFTWQRYLRQAENKGELNWYEKNAIQGVLRHDRADWDPDRIRIGTIHSSKGKEADTVVLALDTTQTIADNMTEELMGEPKNITDAERRVYYVGMTRASQKLVLASGVIDPAMTLSFRDFLHEDHWDMVGGQTQIGGSGATREW